MSTNEKNMPDGGESLWCRSTDDASEARSVEIAWGPVDKAKIDEAVREADRKLRAFIEPPRATRTRRRRR